MPANHDSLAVCSGTRTASPITLNNVFLPPEVWSLVVEDIDDYCWAWFVLRRVSRHLRAITEHVFAIYLLHNCQIRFSGGYVRDLLADIWHTNEYGGGKTGGDIGYWSYETISPLQDQYATFCFRPFQFSPPDTKDRVILKLRDHQTDYKADNADYFVRCDWTGNFNHTQTFYLRRQCCTCPTRIESADAVSRCSCLAKVFFDAEDFKRLTNESHFVFFNDKLMSIRVPSIAINERAQVISLDWRLLCQRFYFEELKLRRAEKPWLRYLSRDAVSGVLRVDALGEKEFPGIGSWAALENVDDSWLFWDQFFANTYRIL